MRRLINYVRSCFCKHEWEQIFNTHVNCADGTTYTVKTYRCRKCGYSKQYRSY